MNICLSFICMLCVSGFAWPAGSAVTVASIDITGTRFPELVRAQLRLTEGHAYNEEALRRAVDRIVRLPFVLDAQSTLVRDTETGGQILRVAVTAAENWSYDLGTAFERHKEDGETYATDTVAFGYRRFVGRAGLLFAGVSPAWDWSEDQDKETTYRVGYAQYDLFGRGVFAALTCEVAGAQDAAVLVDGQYQRQERVSPTLEAGFPLVGDHWLRGAYRRIDLAYRGADSDHTQTYTRDDWRLFWAYTTTDDELLPTTGRDASVGFRGGQSDNRYRLVLPNGGSGVVRASQDDRTTRAAFASYAGYHALHALHGLGYGLSAERRDGSADFLITDLGQGEVSRNRTEGSEWLYDGRVRYAFDPWGRDRARRGTDLRLEVEAFYRRLETKGDLIVPSGAGENVYAFTQHGSEHGVRAAALFRHGWGMVRLSFRYLIRDEVRYNALFD